MRGAPRGARRWRVAPSRRTALLHCHHSNVQSRTSTCRSGVWRCYSLCLMSASRSICVTYAIHTPRPRSEEHTSELESHSDLVCRLLLEKKNSHPPLPVWYSADG